MHIIIEIGAGWYTSTCKDLSERLFWILLKFLSHLHSRGALEHHIRSSHTCLFTHAVSSCRYSRRAKMLVSFLLSTNSSQISKSLHEEEIQIPAWIWVEFALFFSIPLVLILFSWCGNPKPPFPAQHTNPNVALLNSSRRTNCSYKMQIFVFLHTLSPVTDIISHYYAMPFLINPWKTCYWIN